MRDTMFSDLYCCTPTCLYRIQRATVYVYVCVYTESEDASEPISDPSESYERPPAAWVMVGVRVRARARAWVRALGSGVGCLTLTLSVTLAPAAWVAFSSSAGVRFRALKLGLINAGTRSPCSRLMLGLGLGSRLGLGLGLGSGSWLGLGLACAGLPSSSRRRARSWHRRPARSR